ncbi:hypothetical protein ABK040_015030 [Willaertia magna]
MSLTYTGLAKDLKRGSFVIIDSVPCKIIEITFSKVGKHGQSKVFITGIDIFTKKKYQTAILSTKMIEIPVIVYQEYELIDINEKDGFLLLKSDDNERKDNIKWNEEDEIGIKLKQVFEKEKDVNKIRVLIINVMDREQLFDFKIY